MEWIDRKVRGPEKDYFDLRDMRNLFGVSEDWINERVKEGVIPPPIKMSAKTVVYTWRHAIYLSLWLEFFGGQGLEETKTGSGKTKEMRPD